MVRSGYTDGKAEWEIIRSHIYVRGICVFGWGGEGGILGNILSPCDRIESTE